jgi:hypothetical protein
MPLGPARTVPNPVALAAATVAPPGAVEADPPPAEDEAAGADVVVDPPYAEQALTAMAAMKRLAMIR